jgi:hypothetical protein
VQFLVSLGLGLLGLKQIADVLQDPRFINLFRGTSRAELNKFQTALNKTANWSLLRGSAQASDLSENYLRLAATAGVFAHVGEKVCVRVKVVWEESVDATLVGILRAPQPATPCHV